MAAIDDESYFFNFFASGVSFTPRGQQISSQMGLLCFALQEEEMSRRTSKDFLAHLR